MVSSSYNQNQTNAEASFTAVAPQSTNQSSQTKEQVITSQKGATLTQRLLTYILPTALIPLVAAGALEFISVRKDATEQALDKLKLESLIAAEATHIYVLDTYKIPEVIGLDPNVREALVAASNGAVKENMHNVDIQSLEQKYAQTKLIAPNAKLNQYLKDVATIEGFEEIFFTERHGFNVAYSQPTSDFVQRDEDWWQIAKEQKRHVAIDEFDESTGVSSGIEFSEAIIDPSNGNFLGVIKALTTSQLLNEELSDLLSGLLTETTLIEILDAQVGLPVTVLKADNFKGEESTVVTDQIKEIAKVMDVDVHTEGKSLGDIISDIRAASGIPDLKIDLERETLVSGEPYLKALFKIKGEDYAITTIPSTNWVSLVAIEDAEIQAAGNKLLRTFSLITLALGIAATVVLTLLARQLAAPLRALTNTAEVATGGQLDARAELKGTVETKTLGAGFNALLNRLQSLLQEQTEAAEQQQRQRQALEDDISRLMEDVGDAADGDLRVRAQLSEGDVGIVADLFNSIIENLRFTTSQVKNSTGQVTSSLTANEANIRELSVQAAAEVESLKDTMEAVEDIGQSIQEVSDNAGEASKLTQETYVTVKDGTTSMDQTVDSILGLRSTVGETAKKIKRLGESAQKISQAVSLIDEIALKTNLLAVNASVEAARAGEMGEGFTAVAEQVGSLAEQSSSATKEIAQIVAEIQTETQEVVESIETGTAQVVDSSNLVEATKQRLTEALNKSEQITNLMQQISASTKYQTESSAAVSELVREVAEESEKRSESTQQMAQAMKDTTEVAQELEASVEQFKLDDED